MSRAREPRARLRPRVRPERHLRRVGESPARRRQPSQRRDRRRTSHRRIHGPADQRRRAAQGRLVGRCHQHVARASDDLRAGGLLGARRRRDAHLESRGRRHTAAHRVQDLSRRRRRQRHPDDLDGRPSTSARVRRAHMGGFLDRTLGRRDADRRHDAREGRVDSAQRRPRQRPGRSSPSTSCGTATS